MIIIISTLNLLTLFLFFNFSLVPPFIYFDVFKSGLSLRYYSPNNLFVFFLVVFFLLLFFFYLCLYYFIFKRKIDNSSLLDFDNIPFNTKIFTYFFSFSLMYTVIFLYLSNISIPIHYQYIYNFGNVNGSYYDYYFSPLDTGNLIYLTKVFVITSFLFSSIQTLVTRVRL